MSLFIRIKSSTLLTMHVTNSLPLVHVTQHTHINIWYRFLLKYKYSFFEEKKNKNIFSAFVWNLKESVITHEINDLKWNVKNRVCDSAFIACCVFTFKSLRNDIQIKLISSRRKCASSFLVFFNFLFCSFLIKLESF